MYIPSVSSPTQALRSLRTLALAAITPSATPKSRFMGVRTALCGLLSGLFIFAAVTSPVHAEINYAEGVDLTSNLANPDALGSVSLGANSVSGTINAVYNGFHADGDDADSFEFTVPAGQVVTSVRLIVTNFSSTQGAGARVRNFSGGTTVNFISGNTNIQILDAAGGLTAGTYDLQVHGIGGFDPDTFEEIGSISLSWSVLITSVAEVILTTAPASDITTTGATLGGEVTDDGGLEVNERGVVYATTTTPTIDSGIVLTATGGGTGVFSVAAVDLAEGTTYFARAYATNNLSTSYGGEIVFTTGATVDFTNGVSTFSRSILSGGRQVFNFTLAGPRIVSLATFGNGALRAELYDSEGNLITSFDGDANFDLEELLLAGGYALHVFREEDGGSVQTFDLTIDASVVAASRPDVAVGASPGALLGVGMYAPTNQLAALISKKAKAVTGYAGLANRGNLPDVLVGSATGGSGLFAVSYFDPTGNITAGLLSGTYTTPEMDENSAPVVIRATITPNKKKLTKKKKGQKPRILKKTYILSLRLSSTFDPSIEDAASIRVQTK